jgi:hypothetical protein
VRVVLLSGGGGGARFARGLAGVLDEDELTVVGNVGDDVEILGLHVSPDLDSLLYTLSGLIDRDRGWGRSEESWNAVEAAAAWGGEDWFRLGDRDIGLHLVRTRALRNGVSLSEVTAALCSRVSLGARLLPATDERLRTHVTRGPGDFPSRSGSSVGATRMRSTQWSTKEPTLPVPRRESSSRSRRRTPSCSHRATPISHSGRSSRSAISARRSASERSGASR